MSRECVRRQYVGFFGRAEAAFAKLSARTGDDPEAQDSQAAMFMMFSDTYSRLGDKELATNYARKSLEIVRKLSAANPSNALLRAHLAAALQNVALSIRVQGDSTGALAAQREELSIERELVSNDPGNARRWHGLSNSLMNLGYTLTLLDDLDGALTAYRESTEISRKESAKEPDNTALSSDLSASSKEIGDVVWEGVRQNRYPLRTKIPALARRSASLASSVTVSPTR